MVSRMCGSKQDQGPVISKPVDNPGLRPVSIAVPRSAPNRPDSMVLPEIPKMPALMWRRDTPTSLPESVTPPEHPSAASSESSHYSTHYG